MQSERDRTIYVMLGQVRSCYFRFSRVMSGYSGYVFVGHIRSV